MKKIITLLLFLTMLTVIPVTAEAAENGYWINRNGSWYYYYDSGTRAIGWIQDDGVWYYLDTSGVMQTGWEKVGGYWYYLGTNGAMVTGWQQIGGTWYYFSVSGVMQNGWLKQGGRWYHFESSGAMQTGWQKIGSSWYFFSPSGAMHTGWLKEGGVWYYLNPDGGMQVGWQKIEGNWYYFENNGVMYTGRIYTDALYGYYRYGYYLKSNGAMAVGWEKIDGAWYYFDVNGMQQIGWTQVNGKWYYLTVHGGMVTGWLTPSSGEWQSLGMPQDLNPNDSYYFTADGVMVTGQQYIDGKYYTFAPSGALQDYKYFLETGYFLEWEGWQDLEEYAEIDIDKDGLKELVILTESDGMGFYGYIVYGFSKSHGGIVQLEFTEDFVNPGTLYGGLSYSSKYKALVFPELKTSAMTSEVGYFTRLGDTLVSIGSIGSEAWGGTTVYFSTLDGKYKEITYAQMKEYVNEYYTVSCKTLP